MTMLATKPWIVSLRQGGAARQRGFTLLELLVAITLLAMLSVLLYGGVGFGLRVWENSAQSDRVAGDMDAVRSLLRRMLSQATLVYYRDPNQTTQKTRVAFLGNRDSVAFVGPLSQFIGTGGRYRIGLEAEGSGSTRNLILKWERFSANSGAFEFTENVEKEILAKGIGSVAFAYFVQEKVGADPRWMPDWRHNQNMPRLVKIDVAFPQDDSRVWPELATALMTTKTQ